jgi:hypothetical protein
MTAAMIATFVFATPVFATLSFAAHLAASAAFAQGPAGFNVTPREAGSSPRDYDPIQVPSGGRPLMMTVPAAIPRQLQAAIERSQCNVSDPFLAKYPVLIFRPADGRRVMAIAPCFETVPSSRAFVFDPSVDLEPSPMAFPTVAPTGGFSSSIRPGLMTWDAQTRTLTAWRGSDQCPAREIRYTYRQGGGELNGFALSKVEHRRLRCTNPESDWQTLWQSPPWNLEP